ncbi:MAG: hypothetical protein AAB624_02815 [Patescibacteria group bacterium]
MSMQELALGVASMSSVIGQHRLLFKSFRLFLKRAKNLNDWFLIKVSTAKGTGRIAFSCKPNKRLRDLFATGQTLGAVNGCGKNFLSAFEHAESPNTYNWAALSRNPGYWMKCGRESAPSTTVAVPKNPTPIESSISSPASGRWGSD